MRISAFILLLVTPFFSGTVLSQIEHGGDPFMNHDDFDPNAVLYLLDPVDEALNMTTKSTAVNSMKKAIHFAHELPADLSPETNGEWTHADGKAIWRAHIVSPGAQSLGIRFSEYELDDGAILFVYTPSGNHIKGGFTASNNKSYGSFNIGHLPGDEVIVELQVPAENMQYGNLRIGSVFHAFLPYFADKSVLDTGLGTSQDCEIDVICPDGEDWQLIKGSVCHISTGALLCTGVLVNNTLYNGQPYVLTAEHCINRQFRAQGSIFYFGYFNSECGEDDGSKSKSISGSTLLATGDSLDFTLVKLTKKPPKAYNAYYAGWDARPQNHPRGITLHHPNADAMKISFEMEGTVIASSVPGDLNDYVVPSNYHIRKWDIGTTEGGSSGAPLFNASKRVIGVLSGGLAVCGDSIGYDPVEQRPIYSLVGNEDDYYSRVSYAWDYYPEKDKQLKGWLDPANTGQLSIGGLTNKTVDVSPAKIHPEIITIRPNPASDKFTVSLPEIGIEEMTIGIYDLTGSLVYFQKVTDNAAEIDLAGNDAGIYIIKVESEKGQFTGKLMLH